MGYRQNSIAHRQPTDYTAMKRLIICCDGTWNRADQVKDDVPCPTNVVKLGFRVAKRAEAIPQIVHYDQGVGTGNSVDRLTGGAFGHGIEENIHQAYRFLVANYEPGDEIFLIGFSRGAFTARSLGGMIRKCGILKRKAVGSYARAIELYRNDKHPDEPELQEFRYEKAVCEGSGTPIKMIGVWDTVGSLGIPLRGLRALTRRKHRFHDTELSKLVENAFQALAVDEYRAPFEPTLWALKPKKDQRVHQVWFTGAHSDVGGGYALSGLSDIALQWMMDRASECGLVFDPQVEEALPLHPDPMGQVHISKRGMYALTRGIVRSIGVADRSDGTESGVEDPTQEIHPAVLQRWDEDPSYQSAALRHYFERTGDARAAKPTTHRSLTPAGA
jgi:uncharacterized protein (DUF2235 family)